MLAHTPLARLPLPRHTPFSVTRTMSNDVPRTQRSGAQRVHPTPSLTDRLVYGKHASVLRRRAGKSERHGVPSCLQTMSARGARAMLRVRLR